MPLLFMVSIPRCGQTLSPKAEGLFQRAIFQSGVATVGSYTTKNPLPQAQVAGGSLLTAPSLPPPQPLFWHQIIANLTGCDHSSTEEMIQCVKGKPQEELIRVTKKVRLG